MYHVISLNDFGDIFLYLSSTSATREIFLYPYATPPPPISAINTLCSYPYADIFSHHLSPYPSEPIRFLKREIDNFPFIPHYAALGWLIILYIYFVDQPLYYSSQMSGWLKVQWKKKLNSSYKKCRGIKNLQFSSIIIWRLKENVEISRRRESTVYISIIIILLLHTYFYYMPSRSVIAITVARIIIPIPPTIPKRLSSESFLY